MKSFGLNPPARTMLIRVVPLLTLVTLAAAMVGCSGDLNRKQVVKLIESNSPHALPVSARDFTNIEVERQEEEYRWTVDFECVETVAADWLAEMDFVAVKNELADSTQAYEVAVAQHTQVRWPERESLISMIKVIDESQLPRLYRPRYKAGDEIKWQGTATIIDDDNELKLTAIAISSESNLEFDSLTTKQAIEDDAAVCDGGVNDPIVKTRKLQREFIELLAQAEKTVASRLAREQSAIASLVSGETILSGPMIGRTMIGRAMIGRANPTPSAEFLFEAGEAKDVVSAVAIDSQDPFSRVVFDGQLTLPPTPEARPQNPGGHDGWQLVLKNADTKLSPLARVTTKTIGVYFDATSEQYHASDGTRSTPLNTQPNSSVRSVGKQLMALQQVGAQINGTESISGLADRQLTMTVTQFDDSTGNLRVLFADESSPFTFAVFEGKYRTESPHHLGLPIQLKQVAYAIAPDRSAQDSQIFTRGSNYVLTLLPTGKGFIGKYRNADVTLEPAAVNEKVAEGSSRWANVVTTGSVWKGFTQWRSEAVQEVTMRVAEVRENGKYVRLLLEKKDHPLDFVVYEGSWHQTDGQIDGYSLVTLQHGKNTNYDKEYFGVFFSMWESKDPKVFRLSADGTTLFGLSKKGETIILKRKETSEVSDTLTTDTMIKTWPKLMKAGRDWKGLYTNVRINKSTNIKMKVLAYELEGKRVTVEITAEADPRVKAIFQGSVNLSDSTINGFTLTLVPQKDSLSEITLFDAGWEEKFELRYDAATERLVGRCKNYQGLFSHVNLGTEIE